MSKEKQPLSFKTQLTLMTAVTVTFMLLLFIIFFSHTVNNDLQQNIISSVKSHTKLIAERAKSAIQKNDYMLANKTLRELSQIPSVERAAIILPNNSFLSQFSVYSELSFEELDINQPLLLSEQSLQLVESINDNGKIIGSLYVEYDLKSLLDKKNNYYLIIAGIFLLSLVAAFIISSHFQKRLTYPISRIVSRINDIYRSGNFAQRLNARSNDEIGKLMNEFNQMLDEVQEREDELTAQSKQLQRLVDLRTEQLYKKAHFDSLTGLPNRYLLLDRLQQAILKSTRTKANLALLFLDLDRFKIINDNLGHQNGDLLLKEVAKRLSQLARESDTVARFGGDEFIFLLENLPSPKDSARMARRVLDCFKQPFHIQEHILHISTSIGISIYPDDGLDHKTLLKNADISMYHAKEQGSGHFSFYTDEMNQTSLERLTIESNLRTALQKNEFTLVYQPQLKLENNQVKNFEALLRWNNPNLGHVSPAEFIPIAEEMGLINQIDLWVIAQACQQLDQWNKQGFNDLTVAVNISARHLLSDTLLHHLQRQIRNNQVKPGQIEIEITEEVFIENSERIISTLHAIKALGAKIAIDDFGTGYSSLQYIQNFPTDTLKLDGIFIRNLENDTSNQGIVHATILLAHSLGLELVSECVENEFQLDFLRKNECDLIQGYCFSKPLPAEEIPGFLSKPD